MERLVKISKNLNLELLHPFTLIGPEGTITLPCRITNYTIEIDPPKLGVDKEELVEAILNSWILVRRHFSCYNPGDYSLYAYQERQAEKETRT